MVKSIAAFFKAIFYGLFLAVGLFVFSELVHEYWCWPSDDVAYSALKKNTLHLGNGSGSVVKGPSGASYILTNWHVCVGGNWRGVVRGSYESGDLVSGRIVKTSPQVDLCAVKIPNNVPGLSVGPGLSPITPIYTRGYPLGVLTQSKGIYVGQEDWDYVFPIEDIGECPNGSAKKYAPNGLLVGCSMVFHSNLTNFYSRPGSSGSPVVNDQGQLVGVISSWLAKQDSGGMVKFEDIKAFMKGL